MGLDNIPHVYPCKRDGTAVYELGDDLRDRLDCEATMHAGGCPWQTSGLPELAGGVTGIFGTPCWYRGKVATYRIRTVEQATGEHAPHEGFYGNDAQEPNLTPVQCHELADWMADRAEVFSRAVDAEIAAEFSDPETQRASHTQAVLQYRHAVAWLRWAADECAGSDAWW